MPPEVNSADDSATFPAESTAFRTFPPTFSVCGPSFSGTASIVTESGVREAQVDLSMPHAINITLNTQASKTMKEATSAMKVGKDRIAIVVEGRVVNAPCVMAVISQSMIINSLHGEQDAAHLCDVLNRHAAEQKTSPSSPAA